MKKTFSLVFFLFMAAGPLSAGLTDSLSLKSSGSQEIPVETRESGNLVFSVKDTVGGVGKTPGVTTAARILRTVDSKSELDVYGGWLGMQLEATGHFRTVQIDGFWYLADPLGHPFFCVSPNSAGKTYLNNLMPDSLISAGFNSLGNWSDYLGINALPGPDMPYCERFLFLQTYKNKSVRLKNLYDAGVIAVFDPEFETFAGTFAANILSVKDDPWCIGIFSDNELPNYDNTTYGNLLERYLAVDAADPNHIAADEWMKARKGPGYTIDDTDRENFHGYVMGTYYRIVSAAIKKAAPDILYLGSRLHGAAKFKPSVFREAGKYVDVISINYYGSYEPGSADLAMWIEESGKPFLISEFYAMGFDLGMENATGAGFKVPTQADRAVYFENFTLKMLESKGCLGVQWHRFQDDIGPNVNKGFINKNGIWYQPLKSSLSNITKDLYNLRNFIKPLPEGKFAVFYDSADFKGDGVGLENGHFTAADLAAAGINGENISSLKIAEKYKVVLFTGDNFTGDSLVLNSSDGFLENDGFDSKILSLKLGIDFRIIVMNPLRDRSLSRLQELQLDISTVFSLLGDESRPLPVELVSVSNDSLLQASITGSILRVIITEGHYGNAQIIIKAEYKGIVGFDTLALNILETPWNAPSKDTYARGGHYNVINYGSDTVLIVKHSTSEDYTRMSFMGFDLDSFKIPSAYNKTELVFHANSKNSSLGIAVYPVEDNNWIEHELTWLSMPLVHPETIGTHTITGDNLYQNHRIDISNYLLPLFAGGVYSFSIALKATVSVDDLLSIHSAESAVNPPLIEFLLTDNLNFSNNTEWKIYPNPVENILHISYPVDAGKINSIKVYDIHGRLMGSFRKNEMESSSLDITSFPQGLYYLKISSDGENVIRKFIRK